MSSTMAINGANHFYPEIKPNTYSEGRLSTDSRYTLNGSFTPNMEEVNAIMEKNKITNELNAVNRQIDNTYSTAFIVFAFILIAALVILVASKTNKGAAAGLAVLGAMGLAGFVVDKLRDVKNQ